MLSGVRVVERSFLDHRVDELELREEEAVLGNRGAVLAHCAIRLAGIGAELPQLSQLLLREADGLAVAVDLAREREGQPRQEQLQLPDADRSHGHVVLLPIRGRDGHDSGREAHGRAGGGIGRRSVLRDHESGHAEPIASGQVSGQAVAVVLVEETVEPVVGDARQFRQRDLDRFQRHGQRITVEVGPREDHQVAVLPFLEHEGIVGGGVQLVRQRVLQVPEGLLYRAVRLRNSSHRIAVLDTFLGEVGPLRITRLADRNRLSGARGPLATFQVAQDRCGHMLRTLVLPCLVDTPIERATFPTNGLQTEGRGQVGRVQVAQRRGVGEASTGEDHGRSVGEPHGLFRLQGVGLVAVLIPKLLDSDDLPFHAHARFRDTDEHSAKMRQRNEVTAGPHAASLRDDREPVVVQELEELLAQLQRHAGVTSREAVEARQDHPAHRVVRQRSSQTTGVRPGVEVLVGEQVVQRDQLVLAGPTSGVDAVHGLPVVDLALELPPDTQDLRTRVVGEHDAREAPVLAQSDLNERLDGQVAAGEMNHAMVAISICCCAVHRFLPVDPNITQHPGL